MDQVSVIGCGTWGIALASILANNVKDILIYTRQEATMHLINVEHRHPKFDSIALNTRIKAVNTIDQCKQSNLLVFAVPTQELRNAISAAITANLINKRTLILLASKGVEEKSQLLPHEIAQSLLKYSTKIAVLSGPNFAKEILLKKPAGTVIASKSIRLSKEIATYFYTKGFSVDCSTDLVGVAISGAAKNPYAIGAGMILGLNLGPNAHSLYFTKIFNELEQLVVGMGGKKKTVIGLAGIGDLFLTCSNMDSRNMRFGYQFVMNQEHKRLLDETTVEGFCTTRTLYERCTKWNLDLPLLHSLYDILYRGQNCSKLISKLEHTT